LELAQDRFAYRREIGSCGTQHTRQIRSATHELGDLEGLRNFLYLHDNRLSTLPASIALLKSLRYLNISENNFSELPKGVCAMKGLIELRVTDNQLTRLPDCIMNLSNLRELHLRNNKFETLPTAVCGLSELRQLDLRGNPLRSLPECLVQLERLEKLDLRWVDIEVPSWLLDMELRELFDLQVSRRITPQIHAFWP